MRFPILLCGLAAVPVAFAQPADPPKGTVTAEVTEVIRAKPDQARMVYTVSVRNADAAAATDDNDTQTKQFVEAIEKLKLAGVKVATGAVRMDRNESFGNRGVGPGFGEFTAQRAIAVTAADPDPDKLVALVEKVQREAAKQGVNGELGGASYNGMQYERTSSVKVAYSRSEAGWDEPTAAAVTRATKRAVQKAEAMAAGAGLKLGDIVSVGEPPATPPSATANVTSTNPNSYPPSGGVGGTLNPGLTVDTLDHYVDGELVRKVKVRVVYSTK